jgi:hypothetical protein
MASPGDTAEEREACNSVINEINGSLGAQLNFRIDLKKWEDAIPKRGLDGQSVINDQLLQEFEIFIGIMWTRFGTPTVRAGSGTEEEFDKAYKMYSEQGKTEMWMYFNDAEIEPSRIIADQLVRVNNFKKKVAKTGLYHQYKGVQQFEKKLRQHLTTHFMQILGSKSTDKDVKDDVEKQEKLALRQSVARILEDRFESSLRLYSNQPKVWIEPVLSTTNDISRKADDNFDIRISVTDLIESSDSYMIKAAPQFGLTSLSHYLVKEAWEKDKIWIRFDSKYLRKNDVVKSVGRALSSLGLSKDSLVEGIVIDSWESESEGAKTLLKQIIHEYRRKKIIVMQSISEVVFFDSEPTSDIHNRFKNLYLIALPRGQVRNIVEQYNAGSYIAEDNVLLAKIVRDLEVLNIHRTPQNCLTLLKVSENNFDESPVNRTRLIEMILADLFRSEELPTYKSKPDIKDAEYVLGRFCEGLVKDNVYQFSREKFISKANDYCGENLIQLEVEIVFDILHSNNMVIPVGSEFSFKAAYWIYYFIARRMYSNDNFKKYMLFEQSHITSPQVIEFYTGIDRSRVDILELLSSELKDINDSIEEKLGIVEDVNPLENAQWILSEEATASMLSEIDQDIEASNLPTDLKDRLADISYDQRKPYDQTVQQVIEKLSVADLMRKIRTASRALRNSDYVEPEFKRIILSEVTRGWKLISKILFVLAPALAKNGYAGVENQNFILADSFSDDPMKRFEQVLRSNPANVLSYFVDDLYSNKIGPLIYDYLGNQPDALIRHCLMLMVVTERPQGWKAAAENYISTIPDDSFYLASLVNRTRGEYKYGFAKPKELKDLALILKMGIAKHELKIDKPGFVDMKRISNGVIPKREKSLDE